MSRKPKAKTRTLYGSEYGVHGAAEYLKVSRSYLNSLRHHNAGPAYEKRGKFIVYARSDLDAWNAARMNKKRDSAKRLLAKAEQLQARANKMRAESVQLRAA